jgi:hypothetical protein
MDRLQQRLGRGRKGRRPPARVEEEAAEAVEPRRPAAAALRSVES